MISSVFLYEYLELDFFNEVNILIHELVSIAVTGTDLELQHVISLY